VETGAPSISESASAVRSIEQCWHGAGRAPWRARSGRSRPGRALRGGRRRSRAPRSCSASSERAVLVQMRTGVGVSRTGGNDASTGASDRSRPHEEQHSGRGRPPGLGQSVAPGSHRARRVACPRVPLLCRLRLRLLACCGAPFGAASGRVRRGWGRGVARVPRQARSRSATRAERVSFSRRSGLDLLAQRLVLGGEIPLVWWHPTIETGSVAKIAST